MRIIVVGCGRVGSILAYQLYKKGNQVVVIDKDFASFDNLPLDFHGRTVEGDVLSENVLHRAEVGNADGLAAVTNSDSLNALVAYIAKTVFKVTKVVVRNYDPNLLPLQQAFDIDIIGSAGMGAQRIEEFLTEEPLSQIHFDQNDNYAIYQLRVPVNWNGRALKELFPDERIRAVEICRDSIHFPVSDIQALQTGDVIYISGDAGEIETLRTRLKIQKEGSS